MRTSAMARQCPAAAPPSHGFTHSPVASGATATVGEAMEKVIIGNHAAVFAARSDQDRIRHFYCDVLGCKVRVKSDEVDREETVVAFDLSTDEKQTYIQYRHSGWKESTYFQGHCSMRWATF